MNARASRPQLRRPVDRSKDQTYYLAAVPEASLARALFPLAPYKKTEVREMAQKWGLPTASREESMGICFVGEKRRFDDFIGMLRDLICAIFWSDNLLTCHPSQLSTSLLSQGQS